MTIMQNNPVIRIMLLAALPLLLPLIAMQISDAVNWGLGDFAIAWVLLTSVGLSYVLITKKSGTVIYRFAVGLALLAALLLVWINGAVGIIGNEGNSANLIYAGVLAVGFVGALITRFKSFGMALTMLAMAGTQLLAPFIAMMIWQPNITSWGMAGAGGVFILNGFFVALWIGSALLFLRASSSGLPLR